MDVTPEQTARKPESAKEQFGRIGFSNRFLGGLSLYPNAHGEIRHAPRLFNLRILSRLSFATQAVYRFVMCGNDREREVLSLLWLATWTPFGRGLDECIGISSPSAKFVVVCELINIARMQD